MRDIEINALLILAGLLTIISVVKMAFNEITDLIRAGLECMEKLHGKVREYKVRVEVKPPYSHHHSKKESS